MSDRRPAECCGNCDNFNESPGENFGACELIVPSSEDAWATCVSSRETCDDFKPSNN